MGHRDFKIEEYILNARTQFLTYNTLTVAFTVGETITGASSGKTAVVLANDGVSVLTVGSVSGVFTLNETLNGSITGVAKFSSLSSLTGNPVLVEDYKIMALTLASSGNGDFTIKFQSSISNTCPDFSAARSVTNRWEYIQVRDVQNDSAVDGDTGVTFSGSDDVLRFEVKNSGQKWLCATLTTYNAGIVTLTAKLFDNK